MGGSHAHGGSHDHLDLPATQARRARIVLGALTGLLLVATLVGLVALWPSSADRPERTSLLAPGVELISATVTSVPSGEAPAEAVEISAEVSSGDDAGLTIPVEVPPEVAGSGLEAGDRLRVMSVVPVDENGEVIEDESLGGGVSYYYFDHDRSLPLLLLFLVYLVVVALVARGRGLRAVVGLSAGVAVVVWFMLPALLAGTEPMLVAIVGSAAMMFPAVYFAHGVSIRTTTALLGTFGGLALTVLLAMAGADPAGMTGAEGDSAAMLYGADPGLSLSGVFIAGVVVSALGALNDVTITQASSVWELRAAMPGASRRRLFTAAMRIGRDHIASTVYTLAYAYIGAALPLLLIASTIDRSLLATLVSGEISAEVFRTLVASIGLVLTIPLTTGIAAMLAGSADGGTADAGAEEASMRERAATRVTGRRRHSSRTRHVAEISPEDEGPEPSPTAER